MTTRRVAPRGARTGNPKAAPDPKAAPAERPRCKAKSNTTGKQCGQPPIPGGTVCRFHGGNAPQVRAKAAERLMALQPEAIQTLNYLMKKRAVFPSTALGAAKDVLDRTEGRATERVELEVTGELALLETRLAAARKRVADRRKQDGNG